MHYPTDTHLLWDAMRSLINLMGRVSEKHDISGWRQYRFNASQLKKKFRKVQNTRRSRSNDDSKKEQTLARVHESVREYLSIERRLLNGETIPHEEKVFSIFEDHTEWVSKGKAGVPVELGVRVCVLEDQHQFILHHRIMWKETDDKVAVAMIEDTKQRYPALSQCSFDKGFYTPTNREKLDQLLEINVLPKKGRLNVVDAAREASEEFRAARRQHSAVESCINNLEVRGLSRCLSYGRGGFERHVALSVVACNLHRIGLLLQRDAKERLMKDARLRERRKLAA